MSLDILMRKTLNGGLLPTDDAGKEALAKVGKKGDVLVSIKQPRNVAHHRKLFALLSLVHQNQSRYPTVEHLLTAIKIYLGYYKPVRLADGREGCMPDSIAFHSMNQAEFAEFYDRVIGLVVEKILPGVKRDDLERELRDLTGVAA